LRLIGVDDSGEVLGIGADAFPTDDKMSLHLVNFVRDRIGEIFFPMSISISRIWTAHICLPSGATGVRSRCF
jgi:hypothetical protein